ncbi:hypothetical protein IEQ34_018167 [Dendrobium chrysotoxum]|uniref:BHLH domain-containing protein n=2 Tax=Epidendroideae TaxID=158332 RepID=A0AAV7GEN6_DENCH|nr:hypothetical protein IEQ34_018167 [Dendrobium chrysotoxum]
MSSRRSRSRHSASSRITDEQINELISKLQTLLPEARLHTNDRVSNANNFVPHKELLKFIQIVMVQATAAKVLQETCSYIRSLHREVDDLSERLSELLETTDNNSAQAAIIRSLLM